MIHPGREQSLTPLQETRKPLKSVKSSLGRRSVMWFMCHHLSDKPVTVPLQRMYCAFKVNVRVKLVSSDLLCDLLS